MKKKGTIKILKRKRAFFSLFFCFLAIFFISQQARAGDATEPTAAPPEDNMPLYLNIGEEDQVKRGSLRLGSDDTLSPYYYQLEVFGDGAATTDLTAEKNLKVRSEGTACAEDADCAVNEYCSSGSCHQDILFVDSENDKVCIGSCLNVSGSKVEISGEVSLEDNALYSYGETEAVYASGYTYGIQGVSFGVDNIGIRAVSVLDTALEGVNTTNNYSAVFGSSDNGYGIYGLNINPYGLWSGYFDGPVLASLDISGAKFSPTKLQSSLVPFTIGQEVMSYNFANAEVKYFDGTYLWLAETGTGNFLKVRASDGFEIFKEELDPVNPGEITEIIFDGNYIWISLNSEDDNQDGVYKIEPVSGGVVCSNTTISNPQGIVFDGQYYWITASGSNELIKMNNACDEIMISESMARIVISDVNNSLGKIIYNGSYLWAISSEENMIVSINPSTGDAVRWSGLVDDNPQDIFFDNYYYWVTGKDNDSITKYYLSDDKVCSQLNSGSPVACQTDADCGVGGFGACLFAVPQTFGVYDIGNEPSYITYDGTYIWVANSAEQSITRLLGADPSQSIDYSLGFHPTGLVFDTTYLWISGSTGLTKLYSGSGYGSADLKDTLTLQFNNPLIKQEGDINISNYGRIGEDMSAGGDLEVSGNIWGDEADTVISVSGEGTYECPEGYYVKNIVDDGSGVITQIECRPL